MKSKGGNSRPFAALPRRSLLLRYAGTVQRSVIAAIAADTVPGSHCYAEFFRLGLYLTSYRDQLFLQTGDLLLIRISCLGGCLEVHTL